jgi:PEP-CTERM motif
MRHTSETGALGPDEGRSMRHMTASKCQRRARRQGTRMVQRNWIGSVVMPLTASALFGLFVAFPPKAMAGLVTYDISFAAPDFVDINGNPAPGIEVTGAFSFTLDPTQSYGCFSVGCNPSTDIIESVTSWNVTTNAGTSAFDSIENGWYYAPASGDDQVFDSTYVIVSGDAQYGGQYPSFSYMLLTSDALNSSNGTCPQGTFVRVLFGNWDTSWSCSYTVTETDDTSVPEPATLALLGTGLLGLLAVRCRATR